MLPVAGIVAGDSNRGILCMAQIPVGECLPLDVVAMIIGPFRLEIMERLSLCPLDVGSLADSMELDIDHVSYHLRPLRKHGLVTFSRSGTRHVYRLEEHVAIVRSERSVSVSFFVRGFGHLSMSLPQRLAARERADDAHDGFCEPTPDSDSRIGFGADARPCEASLNGFVELHGRRRPREEARRAPVGSDGPPRA